MPKHNNVIPNNHFKKDWARHVKTWLDQPAAKKRRRTKRALKAAKIAPRPASGLLRPIVRPPTVRYNSKVRAGRGFTHEELSGAGMDWRRAQTVGIAVDHRRRNRCSASYDANVARLKAYQARLLVFPRNPSKPKKGDSDAAQLAKAQQFTGALLPVKQNRTLKQRTRAIAADESSDKHHTFAVTKLRRARADAHYVGRRIRREEIRAEKAELAAAKKGKKGKK